MLTLSQIQFYAEDFSRSLKRIVKSDNFKAFGDFPKGGCYASSLLFGHFLKSKNFPVTLVSGTRLGNGQYHAWLRFDSTCDQPHPGVIDLTCCQFPGCDLKCPYVAVGSTWREEEWGNTLSDELFSKELGTDGFVNENHLNRIVHEMNYAPGAPVE